jgi:hypothetical protein
MRIAPLIVLVVALLAATTAPAARASAPCRPKGSKTVAQTSKVRAFTRERSSDDHTLLYACLLSQGKPVYATEATGIDAYEETYSESSFSDVRIAGRYVAWSTESSDLSCKADCPPDYNPTSTSIGIINVRLRKKRAVPGARVMGGGLVVTTTGAVAWTQQGAGGAIDVVASDADGKRTLDTGAIDPKSLTASGSTVRWTNAGAPRTATVR